MCTTLLFNASPNPDGHSMHLAMAVLAGLPGTCETIHLYSENITPCLDCGCCSQGVPCPIADAMPSLLERTKQADLLLFASPLHFVSLTAPLIAFFSRLQPVWQARRAHPDLIFGKVRAAGLVVTGGSSYANMFEPARAVTAAVCISLGIPFAGRATAADTDVLPIAENESALLEGAGLAKAMLLQLTMNNEQ